MGTTNKTRRLLKVAKLLNKKADLHLWHVSDLVILLCLYSAIVIIYFLAILFFVVQQS